MAIGAAIGLGLRWLFRNDENPALSAASAENGDAAGDPPAPAVPSKSSFWSGWMPVLDDAPDAVPTPAPMTEAERQQRIRDNETEIARLKRSAARMSTQITAPARVSKPALAVPRPATPAPAASQRPAPATVAPAPVTSLRDCATAAAPRCVTPQAAPAVAASVTELATPKRFQLKPRKYDRAHLEAVLKAGPLARAAIVKALKAAPFSYGNTLAYTTLQRFGDSLEETPAGLLAWKGAN